MFLIVSTNVEQRDTVCQHLIIYKISSQEEKTKENDFLQV